MQLQRWVDRARHIPLSHLRPVLPGFARRFDEYLEAVERLYAAAAAITGSVVVDLSKRRSTLRLLRCSTRLDVRVVHLVRDSRAVAYSWTRRVARWHGSISRVTSTGRGLTLTPIRLKAPFFC